MYGEYRELTEEELARAVRLDPSQIAGLGPSLDMLRAMLEERTNRRVIQWATGSIGRHAIAAIAEDPSLELAGVWVHTAAKVGKDAGELAGVAPLGISATNSVDDILEDLQNGERDPEELLEDAKGTAEDFIESFGGSGSGTVMVNGESIDFESDVCFAGQGDFTSEGLGTTSDGTPVWVSISYTEDSRDEMLEFMDETKPASTRHEHLRDLLVEGT